MRWVIHKTPNDEHQAPNPEHLTSNAEEQTPHSNIRQMMKTRLQMQNI
jgi:hypothetical protein